MFSGESDDRCLLTIYHTEQMLPAGMQNTLVPVKRDTEDSSVLLSSTQPHQRICTQFLNLVTLQYIRICVIPFSLDRLSQFVSCALRWWREIVSYSSLYFCDICSPIVSVPFRSRLRSADNDDMIVPRTRTARYGPRSFRVAAPKIWNMLPSHLKNSSVSREQFKSGIKKRI